MMKKLFIVKFYYLLFHILLLQSKLWTCIYSSQYHLSKINILHIRFNLNICNELCPLNINKILKNKTMNVNLYICIFYFT